MTTAFGRQALTCFVVSENDTINAQILQISRELSNIKVIGASENREQQCAEIKVKMPDFIFWDKAAIFPSSLECLKKMLSVPQIVLLSKAGEVTLDLPDYLVTTEIEHPFETSKFAEAMALVSDIQEEKARLRLKKNVVVAPPDTPQITIPDYVFLRVEGSITRFDVAEILYFHGQGDYVMMKTTRGTFRLNTIMKSLLRKLQHPLFLKTHRAFVVNISKISRVEEKQVIIGEDTILISRSHRALVRKKLDAL
jgi:DNA-binding LytR/AlgR family response regulator